MLSIIVAIGNNNAIGKDNNLLWRIPRDLKRFKEITTGHTLIMGRKTFESLPGILPNRPHVVLTRDNSFKVQDERVKVINSIEDIKPFIEDKEEHFVVGGGEIYKLLLPYTKKLYLTKVYHDFDADTFFPGFDESKWKVISTEKGIKDDKNPYDYEYIDMVLEII